MLKKALILFTIFLVACSELPSGVIPKQKMENVLWDVAQGGEFLNGFVYYKHPEQNRAAVNHIMMERIFKIHKVSKEEFENSLEYYREHPKLLIEILDSITAKQNRLLQDTAQKTPAPPSGSFTPAPESVSRPAGNPSVNIQ